MAVLKRAARWLFQVLVLIDQAALLLIQAVTYVVFGHGKPNADETISSHVGRSAMQRKRWALIAERIINTLFFFDPDHCRKRIEWEDL